MSNLMITDALRKAIAADVANTEKSIKGRHALIDMFVAGGFRWTDFISPKGKDSQSTATPELYASLKEAVVSGFTTADQALIKMDTRAAAALKPEKAARRSYVQKQIGSRMSDYKAALKRRQETGGAGGGKRGAYDRFMDHLSKAINTLKEESEFPFDVVEMLATLAKADGMAKPKAKVAKAAK
jgi:hypothetical protein